MTRISSLGLSILALLLAPALGAEIIGHRGASYDAPENTLAAVNLGWEQDIDAVEIDIHLTADNRIVAIHDKTTKRIGGKDLPVAQQTLEELQQLDVGSWKGPQFQGERIPTLEAILKTIPAGKRLFIEIKAGAEILPELERVLKAAGRPPEQTPLIAFSYETLRAAKERLPALEMYWLVSLERNKETGRLNHTAADLIQKTKAAHLDGLDLGNTPPLDAAFVQAVKNAGLGLYVWTVNDLAKAREYQELGVDGITTDRPKYLEDNLSGDAQ